MFFETLCKGVFNKVHSLLRSHWSVQKVCGAGALHHLSTSETGHLTETIRTEYDMVGIRLGVGHQKATICK